MGGGTGAGAGPSRGCGGGTPDAHFRLMSINVTQLNKARLEAVLDAADAEQADAICLQETRHPDGGFPWASRAARRRGWLSQWSPTPPGNARGVRGHGGTAIMWRTELGKSAAVKSDTHRVCGRTWRECCLMSVYGDASQEDWPWLSSALRTAEGHSSRVQICVGDYNWRAGYQRAIAGGWQAAPVLPTTVDSAAAAPTRCLVRGASCNGVQVLPLVGVPHHCIVVYAMELQMAHRPSERRLRRCAVYQWHVSPRAAECEHLHQAADAAGPPLFHSTGDVAAVWDRWHARAEAVLRCAERLGLAVCTARAERAKGSLPTARPAAHGAAHRLPESVGVRRLKRLHRAAAEQHRRGAAARPLTEEQCRHWKAAVRDGLVARVPRSQEEAVRAASDACHRACRKQQQADDAGWR